MSKTVYRSVGSVRRTPRVRMNRKATTGRSGFDDLLVKLGFASRQLQQTRARSR